MKNYFFKIQVTLIITLFLPFVSCKVRKQSISQNEIKTQSTSQLSGEKQKSANLTELFVDSSKTVKKDSALISVTEKNDVEYDYHNPGPGSPYKVVRRSERTANFRTGLNVISQKNIKSVSTATLATNETRKDVQKNNSKENHQSTFNLISSSVSWIWIVSLMTIIAAIAIYLIKKLNLISLIRSAISTVI